MLYNKTQHYEITMNEKLIATKIIQNSILSSVYIDDNIVEPFVEKNHENEQYYRVSKGLFDSFRIEKKSIDFYQYNQHKNWNDDIDYIFKNRDLLILDWQLNATEEIRQPETLKILKKAVETDNLHFVSIYTESKNLDEILYSIKAYFDNSFNKDSKNACELLIEELDDESGIDILKLFENYKSSFFQLALTVGEERKNILKELKVCIREELGPENYKIFSKGINKINTDVNKACNVIGYYLHKEDIINETYYETEVKTDYITDNFIVVNHTIIQVTNKNDPEPKDLFNFFTNAIQKVAGNLLTLISLEVRGLLRESSGFIGKDADIIKDEILFHQLEKKEGFFDFLMSIIKSHTLSYFDHKQGKLQSVTRDFWDTYKKDKNLENSLNSFKENDNLIIEEIKKLNVYYNTLHLSKNSETKLRFGDLFYTVNDNQKKDGRFYLCVTAHCDCLNPKDNIKNNFFFIGGQIEKNSEKLIKEGDGGFNSYIRDSDEIFAIRWNPRPIVINISDSKITDNKLVGKDGLEKEYILIYHSTIKENYTQRMANNSFAHAMRVGVDFATL